MGASILSASGPREGGSKTEGRRITRCVNVKVLAMRTLGEAVHNIEKCPPPSSQGAGVFIQHPLSALAEGLSWGSNVHGPGTLLWHESGLRWGTQGAASECKTYPWGPLVGPRGCGWGTHVKVSILWMKIGRQHVQVYPTVTG